MIKIKVNRTVKAKYDGKIREWEVIGVYKRGVLCRLLGGKHPFNRFFTVNDFVSGIVK